MKKARNPSDIESREKKKMSLRTSFRQAGKSKRVRFSNERKGLCPKIIPEPRSEPFGWKVSRLGEVSNYLEAIRELKYDLELTSLRGKNQPV